MTFIESTFLCEFYEIEALQVELKPKSCDRVTIVLPYWHVLGIAFPNFMSNTLDLPFSFGFKTLIVCPPVVKLSDFIDSYLRYQICKDKWTWSFWLCTFYVVLNHSQAQKNLSLVNGNTCCLHVKVFMKEKVAFM